MKNRRLHFVRSAVLLLATLALTGCRSNLSKDWKFSDLLDMDKPLPWQDDEPKIGKPARIVGTWADTVLHKQGQQPQRGFGGRLLFYDREGEAPIRVDGQLVVYAFDEANRDPTDNRPTRRYVFPPGQLEKHRSDSKLGPSYSFWLPWDAQGGPQTEISLICRFEPREGTVVVSDQTSHLLPGTMLASKDEPADDSKPGTKRSTHPIQRASYVEQAAAAEEQAKEMAEAAEKPIRSTRMQTTTISLPGKFRQR